MGNPNPKMFRFQKFVLYSPEKNAKKFADFNGIIIFKIRQK